MKPLLDALKATGSRLAAAWNHRVSELHAAYQLTEEEVNKAKSDVKKIGEEITTTEVRRSDSAKDRAAAESAIRNFEKLGGSFRTWARCRRERSVKTRCAGWKARSKSARTPSSSWRKKKPG